MILEIKKMTQPVQFANFDAGPGARPHPSTLPLAAYSVVFTTGSMSRGKEQIFLAVSQNIEGNKLISDSATDRRIEAEIWEPPTCMVRQPDQHRSVGGGGWGTTY
jgi:hypothetical protein